MRIDSLTGRATGPPVVPDDSSYPIRPDGPEAVRAVNPIRDDERSGQPGQAIQDELTLSPEALALANSDRLPAGAEPDEQSSLAEAKPGTSEEARAGREAALPKPPTEAEEADGEEAEAAQQASAGEEESEATDSLSPREAEIVRDLKKRDREVRSHEQAHLSTAGSLANGGVQIDYERGPDGKQYAVAGSVNVTLKEGNSPEETLRIAQQAQRAALAPADPSPQDRQVAADAARLEQDARRQLQVERADSAEGSPEVSEVESGEATRPTDVADVSESAPSDARPDPAQIRAAEAQADQARDRRDEGQETAAIVDREQDAQTLGLSRRAVRAYTETNDLSREPDRHGQVYA